MERGTEQKTAVSKIDVIEQHLITSVQMIAMDASAVSTHVIVKACEEMIASVANSKGIVLDWDYRVLIRDEFHALWRRKAVRAYNYFKHANWDADADYPSLENLKDINELLTILNISGHAKIGGANIPILTEFSVMMSALQPSLFKLEFLDNQPEAKRAHQLMREIPPRAMKPALLASLYKKGLMPKIPPI